MNCSAARVPSLEFTHETLVVIICYLVVFVLALVGNVTMFLILFRNQLAKRRRVHSLLLHMCIGHLLVTLIYMPKEMLHNYTVVWLGGDTLCRLCKFFDVFGVSLTANILCALSLDRFYSILFPLYAINAKKSVLRMIIIAWTIALLSSLPQIYIFRTAQHPCFDWYTQCVSIDLIGLISPKITFWFSVLNIIEVYFLPLIVIVVCYGSILVSISIKSGSWRGSKLLKSKSNGTAAGPNQALLRRTGGQDNFERAKHRTLQMSIIVVIAFLLCWTPYTAAMFIYFMRASTNNRPLPALLSKLLYAFAVFNSAITPYLYGYFSFNIRYELEMLFCCILPCYSGNSTVGQGTNLVGRRRAIRQRPDHHSLTNNSTSALSPTSINTSGRNTTMTSSAIDSRSARVRRLGSSAQACSFDEESVVSTQARRPSRILINRSSKGDTRILCSVSPTDCIREEVRPNEAP